MALRELPDAAAIFPTAADDDAAGGTTDFFDEGSGMGARGNLPRPTLNGPPVGRLTGGFVAPAAGAVDVAGAVAAGVFAGGGMNGRSMSVRDCGGGTIDSVTTGGGGIDGPRAVGLAAGWRDR